MRKKASKRTKPVWYCVSYAVNIYKAELLVTDSSGTDIMYKLTEQCASGCAD